MKKSVAPSRIKPSTFRLVHQCLNQLRHRVPIMFLTLLMNTVSGLLLFIVCSIVTSFSLNNMKSGVLSNAWIISPHHEAATLTYTYCTVFLMMTKFSSSSSSSSPTSFLSFLSLPLRGRSNSYLFRIPQ